MTWQVEIHEAGQFEAVLHYACPAVDIGSAIQLACGKSAWKGTIAVAHDPPARGAENDRVPRKGEPPTSCLSAAAHLSASRSSFGPFPTA